MVVLCSPLQHSSAGWLRTGWVTWNYLASALKGQGRDRKYGANVRPEIMITLRLNMTAGVEVGGKAGFLGIAWSGGSEHPEKNSYWAERFIVSPISEPRCETWETKPLSLVQILPHSVNLDSFLMSLSLLFLWNNFQVSFFILIIYNGRILSSTRASENNNLIKELNESPKTHWRPCFQSYKWEALDLRHLNLHFPQVLR